MPEFNPNVDPNYSPEMTRYRALDLAIRHGQDSPEETVARAAKYAEFITSTGTTWPPATTA